MEVDIASGSSRADAGSGTEWVGTQIVGGSFSGCVGGDFVCLSVHDWGGQSAH